MSASILTAMVRREKTLMIHLEGEALRAQRGVGDMNTAV
jgi:hypothetical protein